MRRRSTGRCSRACRAGRTTTRRRRSRWRWGRRRSRRSRDYAQAMVDNARALADALLERGFELVSGGTDNHLLLIDLTNRGVGGRPAAETLERAGLVLNYNAVPFDPRPPLDPSGIRLGTPAVTTRGLGHRRDAPWRRGSTRRWARTRRAGPHPRRGHASWRGVSRHRSAREEPDERRVELLRVGGVEAVRGVLDQGQPAAGARAPALCACRWPRTGRARRRRCAASSGRTVRVLRRLVDERRHRTREDGGGDALGAVEWRGSGRPRRRPSRSRPASRRAGRAWSAARPGRPRRCRSRSPTTAARTARIRAGRR